MEHGEIRTEVGTFKDNIITTIEGNTIHCLSYSRLLEKIEGLFGAFNLRWSTDIDRWILFQYAPIDELNEDVSQI